MYYFKLYNIIYLTFTNIICSLNRTNILFLDFYFSIFNYLNFILVKKPSPPGFPQVYQKSPSVYMVYWDPSESPVKSYSLERITISEIRNKRSLNLNTTNWTIVYSGSSN